MEPTPWSEAKDVIRDGDVLQYRAAPWLYRGVSIPQKVVGKYIATAGRSEHCHTGLAVRMPPSIAESINSGTSPKNAVAAYLHAAKWGGESKDDEAPRIYCVQMLVSGGSCDPLEDEVETLPGLIDVYRPKAAFYVPPANAPTLGSPRRFLREFDPPTAASVCREMLSTVARNGYGKMNVLIASLQNLPVTRFLVRPSSDDGSTRNRPPHCSNAVARSFRLHYVDPVPHRADHDTIPGDLSASLLFDHVMRLVR